MKETRSSETASSAPQSGLRALVGSVFTGDRVLWIIIAALAVISVLVVYSSTAKMAYDAHTARSTAHFLRQQVGILILCVPIIVIVHKINCRVYNRLAQPVYVLSLLLTLAVYFIGATTNGAARWIPVAGFQFQPSEALKVATILLLARRLSSCQSKIDRIRIVPSLNPFRWGRPAQRKIWREGTRPILLPVVLSCAVIFPAHTSSAMLVFLTSLVMMLIGRVRVSELVRLVGLACAALLLAGLLNLGRSETAGGRVSTWIDLWTSSQTEKPIDRLTDTERSMIAIHNGGLLGEGAGQSAMRVRKAGRGLALLASARLDRDRLRHPRRPHHLRPPVSERLCPAYRQQQAALAAHLPRQRQSARVQQFHLHVPVFQHNGFR